MKRILLGQLGSNGDCLYATAVARQIKHDFPGCHLTWGISSLCARVLDNNPHVDEVWEVPVSTWGDVNKAWVAFEREGWGRVARGDFDHAFMTQICPSYFANYDGTVRPSLFRNYPRPITVPVETVIELTDAEREQTLAWMKRTGADNFERLVVFECSSKSGQSFMTPALAVQIAEKVIAGDPRTGFVLSTHEPVSTASRQILHGGELSMRQTAYLTHYANLFVGCGSGLTVVATSSAAKPGLPNIQVLSASTSVYASFKHDFEFFGKDSSHFLEMTTDNPQKLAQAIAAVLRDGVPAAQTQFGQAIPLDFKWYFHLIDQMLLNRRDYIDAGRSLLTTAGRYGWRAELAGFGRTMILPFLEMDDTSPYPNRRRDIDAIRAGIAAAPS